MTREDFWRVAKPALLGGTAFWLPDTVWHVIRRYQFNGRDVIGDTFLMCSSLLAVYLSAKRSRKQGRFVGGSMILGVWCFGSLFMTIAASFAGGGFANGFSEGLRLALTGLVPLYAFVMSTYDGSLGALLLANFAALIILIFQLPRFFRRHVRR